MPNGVVRSVDTKRGEVKLLRAGRAYVASIGDVVPAARAPGARVHFDVNHREEDRAFNVDLLPGSRRRRHVVVTPQDARTVPEREETGLAGEPQLSREDVQVLTRGDISGEDVRVAREKVANLTRRLGEPVLFARVKLTHGTNPSVERPFLAEADLDVKGDVVRAHVPAHDGSEAVDLLVQRLEDKLRRRSERIEGISHEPAESEPGEWRHGMLPTARPPYFDRPPEEREVVRRKSFAAGELTAEEAVFDMQTADYDFYLFTDLASGRDCLLRRGSTGKLELQSTHPDQVWPGEPQEEIEVLEVPAPVLDLEEALERMESGGGQVVFYRDASTDRGSALYRRYDGHYGLIVPAVEEPSPGHGPAVPSHAALGDDAGQLGAREGR